MTARIELEDFELLRFFGVEPETRFEDDHWSHDTHTYDVTRARWRVVVTLSPADKSIHIRLYHAQILVCECKSEQASDIYLVEHDHRQWLIVEFSDQSTCSLRLEPQPMLQWNHAEPW